jgi:hypothetical protein
VSQAARAAARAALSSTARATLATVIVAGLLAVAGAPGAPTHSHSSPAADSRAVLVSRTTPTPTAPVRAPVSASVWVRTQGQWCVPLPGPPAGRGVSAGYPDSWPGGWPGGDPAQATAIWIDTSNSGGWPANLPGFDPPTRDGGQRDDGSRARGVDSGGRDLGDLARLGVRIGDGQVAIGRLDHDHPHTRHRAHQSGRDSDPGEEDVRSRFTGTAASDRWESRSQPSPPATGVGQSWEQWCRVAPSGLDHTSRDTDSGNGRGRGGAQRWGCVLADSRSRDSDSNPPDPAGGRRGSGGGGGWIPGPGTDWPAPDTAPWPTTGNGADRVTGQRCVTLWPAGGGIQIRQGHLAAVSPPRTR